MTRSSLLNPDHIWGTELSFADVVQGLSREHDQHAASIKDLEQKLKDWERSLGDCSSSTGALVFDQAASRLAPTGFDHTIAGNY